MIAIEIIIIYKNYIIEIVINTDVFLSYLFISILYKKYHGVVSVLADDKYKNIINII